MKRGLLLLVFLVICGFAYAMVPRDRRAVNTEEEEELLRSEAAPRSISSNSQGGQLVCEPQTPCAWSVYKSQYHDTEMNITNDYCSCGPGTVCQISEDNKAGSVFVLRCRSPSEHGSES